MAQDSRATFESVSFFAKALHELRSLIQGIMGLSDHLSDNWNTIDENTKKLCISDISASTQLLAELIEKLFHLAITSKGNSIHFNFEKINIIKPIKEAIEQSKLLIIDKNSINILLDCDQEEINIFADPLWIRQLTFNLVSNAIKYSGGKNIRVKVDINPLSDSQAPSQNLMVSVIDDGLGVKQSELETIFNPFKQGSNIDKSLKGTGLGLTICREIVAAHNGNIKAINNDEGGFSVSFSLSKTR